MTYNALQLESIRHVFQLRESASLSLVERMARDSRDHFEKMKLLSGFSLSKQLEESMRAFDLQRLPKSFVAGSLAADMTRLMADLKPLSTFGSEQWSVLSQSIFADAARQRTVFDQLSQSLLLSHPGLNHGVAEHIASAISAAGNEDAVPAAADAESIEEVVARAVTSALAQERGRVDWRFVVGLIITILVFLYDHVEAESSAAQSAAEMARIEAHVLEVSARLDLILTRPVLRSTALRSRPHKNSPKIGTILSGSTVVVQEYRGKWVKVTVFQKAPPGAASSALVGWLLKKYLGAAL